MCLVRLNKIPKWKRIKCTVHQWDFDIDFPNLLLHYQKFSPEIAGPWLLWWSRRKCGDQPVTGGGRLSDYHSAPEKGSPFIYLPFQRIRFNLIIRAEGAMLGSKKLHCFLQRTWVMREEGAWCYRNGDKAVANSQDLIFFCDFPPIHLLNWYILGLIIVFVAFRGHWRAAVSSGLVKILIRSLPWPKKRRVWGEKQTQGEKKRKRENRLFVEKIG